MWLCTHKNIIAVEVGQELNTLYFNFNTLCDLAKVEYTTEV
jgi:hypothetical protein